MTFTKPVLPGTAVTFIGQTVLSVPVNFAKTVAVLSTADWGPLKTVERFNSLAEFETAYGRNASAARTAVVQAFAGSAVTGAGGAGAVVFYRLGGSAAQKATHTFLNTAGSPASALTVTAKYEGAAGNLITISIEDDPNNSGSNDLLRVIYNGAQVEVYSYAQTDIATLASNLSFSQYVTATSLVTGTSLALTGSPVALTTGADGATLLTSDYTTALSALEFEEFGIITYDGTDSSVQTAFTTWVQSMADAFKPVRYVCGGAPGESTSTAIARSTAVPAATKHHVVNVGVGTYNDDLLGLQLGTAQLAPRVAGILAGRGETQSLTFADLGALHVVAGTGANTSQLQALRDGGVTAIRRVSSPNTELKISQGVTTFTTATVDPSRPYAIFSEPRMVGVMDDFIRTVRQWADDNIIGDTTVTDGTRAAVRGFIQGLLNDMVAAGIILPDPTPFVRTPVPTDPSLLDTIPFEFGFTFARTVDNVIGVGQVL